MKCGRRLITITNENKVLFKKPTLQKKDIVAYYCAIAPYMLKYTKQRPITMMRYPDGIDKEGFYHKDAPEYFPKWIPRIAVKKKEGGFTNYVIINEAATLGYLANYGCLTPHLWLSKIDALEKPDRMIFDIDPEENSFYAVQETAFLLKEILESLDLMSFVMTTGSKGMHVVVPLKRYNTFDEVRAFAGTIGEYLVSLYPEKYTMELSIKKRKKRIFLDVLRNSFGATAVAPYSLRAKPGAPVATPLLWQEAGKKGLTSQFYTLFTIFDRLKKVGDVWEHFDDSARSLNAAQKLFKKKVLTQI